MQNNDSHNNLLIISKGDQLEHDQFKETIINDCIDDSLLPLHDNLPLITNQNESLLGNDLELNVLNKQTEHQFSYDTFKQLQLEQNCLLPALDENLVNLMNATTVIHSGRQFNTFDSPYITKNALVDSGRIIYSTIANTVNNSIDLNDSISLSNNAIQSSNNLSTMLTNTNNQDNKNDLIEMSVNNSTTIYSTMMVSFFFFADSFKFFRKSS